MGKARLGIIVGVGLGILLTPKTALAQSESPRTGSFSELQSRLHQGDTVSVDTATARIVGQVVRLSDVWLEMLIRGTPIRLHESEIRRIRLRDPIDADRVTTGAAMGLLVSLACASSTSCRPWETGDFSLGGMLGFLGFLGAGAGAGALTAATLDALHTPTLFVSPTWRPPASPPASRASGRGVALNIVLRF